MISEALRSKENAVITLCTIKMSVSQLGRDLDSINGSLINLAFLPSLEPGGAGTIA